MNIKEEDLFKNTKINVLQEQIKKEEIELLTKSNEIMNLNNKNKKLKEELQDLFEENNKLRKVILALKKTDDILFGIVLNDNKNDKIRDYLTGEIGESKND